MRERELHRRYQYEFFFGLGLYTAILIFSLSYVGQLAPGTAATLVHVSPMLGIAFILRSMLRWYRGADEYQRRITLENIAIAALATAVITFTYGFLENAGWPKLTMFVVWPMMGSLLGATLITRSFLQR